jgi:ubiquinone/menaquinone biosynthesis C-methylase UbiE
VIPKHPWDPFWESSSCLQEQLEKTEYWEDPRIHTLGNSGVLGALHAGMAPLFTGMIDVLAHDMRQPGGVRAATAETLAALPPPATYGMRGGGAIVDLCCGIGASTRVMQEAFPAARVVGVDASDAMLRVARNYERLGRRLLAKGKEEIEYATGNAEKTGLPVASFDIATCFYGFHEVPHRGRQEILNEMQRLLIPGGYVAILDISPSFTPSHSMLAGEPYILEYQANITEQLQQVKGLVFWKTVELVAGQVSLWILKKSSETEDSKDSKESKPYYFADSL